MPRTQIHDIEAQTAAIASPAPAYTQGAQTPSTHCYPNMFDDFFGIPVTRESLHDNSNSYFPPPYPESLPGYSLRAEPATLAMYLFKFGFLFPPFWIMGVVILLSPLSAPEESWLPAKSEEERLSILSEIRKVEVKWAKRCLCALITLILVAVTTGLAVWVAHISSQPKYQ
ncbi:hypothetical protein AMATHDRAFT_148596 [Amanita thiersii Skay4041]|uniref:Transmembrane protein n=1 Tax=Amanita thiersii Skay4041 TaxID=703135 RepID=A0A2A9NMR6_9AGAR|nr:hypothetical protein AMATHDRAFT_148596 [Amanita thiersii Skay4041]